MSFTDTHTHLYLEQFNDDIDSVIENSISSNVNRLFLPAINSSHTESMLLLKERYPENIFLMSGLHPCYVETNFLDEIKHVEMIISENEIVAVGEIGIDLYWDKTNLEIQIEAFESQISIANSHNLPIVIHCRESFDEIYNVLNKNKVNNGGIFHCFSGDLSQANKIIDMGMKLGIGGVVTFKNGKIDKFLKDIDISNIVLETDSPYLAPVPLRGKSNEPSYLVHTVEFLSKLKKISYDEFSKITSNNFFKLFGNLN